jgi:hypothetical protein
MQKTKNIKIQDKLSKLTKKKILKGSGYLNEALKILNYELLVKEAHRRNNAITAFLNSQKAEKEAQKAASDTEVANILAEVKAQRAEAQAKQLLLMKAIAENEALKKLSTREELEENRYTLKRKGSESLDPTPEQVASTRRRYYTTLPHNDIKNPNTSMVNLFSTKPYNPLEKKNAHSKKTALSVLNTNKEKEVYVRTTTLRTKQDPEHPDNPIKKIKIPKKKPTFYFIKKTRRRNPKNIKHHIQN